MLGGRHNQLDHSCQCMHYPGVEPGLSLPQSEVLTTILIVQLTVASQLNPIYSDVSFNYKLKSTQNRVLFVTELALILNRVRCYRDKSEHVCATVSLAAIAQLGERQTEDLKVPGSIPGGGRLFFYPDSKNCFI